MKEETKKRIEIMAPAGSFEALDAAIKAGADSVYFGVAQLNMRAKAANNFSLEDLETITKICKEKNIKTYLTVNTVMYNHDIILMKKIIDAAKKAGITAVIASDIAAITYAHSIGVEIHISTQTNVSNMETVRFWAAYADVIVLARELPLNQVMEITKAIEKEDLRGPSGELLQIELFAHGALCVAISGKCYMSLATDNSSANRGACFQNCRREYKVIDEKTGDELVIDNKYIMSPKDLCTIRFVDKLLDAGVRVFKLEGRGRSPEYVYTVTKAYREAAEAHYDGSYTKEKINAWEKDLEKVFNRGFWHGGYYLGKKLGEWSGKYGSHAKTKREFLGRAITFFKKQDVGEFYIETGELHKGEKVTIAGPTTGFLQVIVEDMRVDNKPVDTAKKGENVTFKVPERIRKNDKLFVIRNV
jgi:U32 family peptidase